MCENCLKMHFHNLSTAIDSLQKQQKKITISVWPHSKRFNVIAISTFTISISAESALVDKTGTANFRPSK